MYHSLCYNVTLIACHNVVYIKKTGRFGISYSQTFFQSPCHEQKILHTFEIPLRSSQSSSMRYTDLQLGRGGVGCVLNKHLKVKVKSNLLPHCH